MDKVNQELLEALKGMCRLIDYPKTSINYQLAIEAIARAEELAREPIELKQKWHDTKLRLKQHLETIIPSAELVEGKLNELVEDISNLRIVNFLLGELAAETPKLSAEPGHAPIMDAINKAQEQPIQTGGAASHTALEQKEIDLAAMTVIRRAISLAKYEGKQEFIKQFCEHCLRQNNLHRCDICPMGKYKEGKK